MNNVIMDFHNILNLLIPNCETDAGEVEGVMVPSPADHALKS